MVAGKRSYNGGMGKLLLLFIIVPAVELGLLIQVGIYLGTWPTLALIVFTGIVGAYLARRQGLSVLTCAQEQMDRGELPASSLADGVMILVAGALLMASRLVNELVEARQEHELSRIIRRYARFELLCIDELGYVPLADVGAELLFQVISERSETAALVITTNLPFSEWTQVFTNARLCKALLDRVTDQARAS